MPTPSPFFRYWPRAGASLIIGLHAAGCHRSIHIAHDLQLSAFTGDFAASQSLGRLAQAMKSRLRIRPSQCHPKHSTSRKSDVRNPEPATMIDVTLAGSRAIIDINLSFHVIILE